MKYLTAPAATSSTSAASSAAEGKDAIAPDVVQDVVEEIVSKVTQETFLAVAADPPVRRLCLLEEHRYWCPWARLDTYADLSARQNAWSLCRDALDQAHGSSTGKRRASAAGGKRSIGYGLYLP